MYENFLKKVPHTQTKTHTDIFVNQSEARTSELVSSLSAYESMLCI